MAPVGARSGILMLWARIVSCFQLSRPLLRSFRASKSQKVYVGAGPSWHFGRVSWPLWPPLLRHWLVIFLKWDPPSFLASVLGQLPFPETRLSSANNFIDRSGAHILGAREAPGGILGSLGSPPWLRLWRGVVPTPPPPPLVPWKDSKWPVPARVNEWAVINLTRDEFWMKIAWHYVTKTSFSQKIPTKFHKLFWEHVKLMSDKVLKV